MAEADLLCTLRRQTLPSAAAFSHVLTALGSGATSMLCAGVTSELRQPGHTLMNSIFRNSSICWLRTTLKRVVIMSIAL